jgi:hypothetical protein
MSARQVFVEPPLVICGGRRRGAPATADVGSVAGPRFAVEPADGAAVDAAAGARLLAPGLRQRAGPRAANKGAAPSESSAAAAATTAGGWRCSSIHRHFSVSG